VQFLKQAGVLNSYDGLSSKVRDQLDLLVGEGPDFLSENADRTDQLALLEHRHVQQTARAPKFGGRKTQRLALRISLLGLCIYNVDGLPRAGNAAQPGRIGPRLR